MSEYQFLDCESYEPTRLMGSFVTRQFQQVFPIGTTLLVPSDPTRTTLFVYDPVGAPLTTWGILWGTAPNTAPFLGNNLGAGILIKWEDYPTLPGYDWYIRVSTAPATIGVWEISYRVQTSASKRNPSNRSVNGFPRDAGFTGKRRTRPLR